MTPAETKLLFVIFLVVCTGSWFSGLSIRKTLTIFFLGCLVGLMAQLSLGPHFNRYTPNIAWYLSYVSVAVILAWGTGLACIWMVHLWTCRTFRLSPNLLTHLISGVPVILVLEAIGSNIILMKLHDYRRYESLMPMINAMHAPVWLYGYYLLISFIFYFFLQALAMNNEDWSGVAVALDSPFRPQP